MADAEAADAGATDSKAADAEAAAAEAAAARAPVPGLLSSADLEYVYRGVPFPFAVVSRVLPAAAVRIHISIMRDTHTSGWISNHSEERFLVAGDAALAPVAHA